MVIKREEVACTKCLRKFIGDICPYCRSEPKAKEPTPEYYFCRDRKDINMRTFFITPVSYFNERGFLYDSCFDINVKAFERVSDSTFVYIGNKGPIDILLKDGRFAWRDMDFEITMKYERRRALGIDDQDY